MYLILIEVFLILVTLILSDMRQLMNAQFLIYLKNKQSTIFAAFKQYLTTSNTIIIVYYYTNIIMW